MDNIPCLDVDAIDGDCSCDVTPVASLGSDEKDCILKEGNPKLNVSPESKSTLSEQQADLVKDSHEPRCTFSDMEPRDSCPEVPSPGKRQLNCALSNSPLINKPVDMASDANESMAERSPTSPSSDVAEDDVSLNGDMSDHCFGHIPMDNLERTVVISPDYVLYQNDYHTGVSVIFSPSGVKIEGSTVSEHQRTFSFESRIDDIISINCRWFQRVGYMTLKMKVLSKVAIESENACDTSADEELKFTVIDPRWSEKHAAIISLNFQYQALWNIMPDPLAEMDGDDSLVQRSYFPNFDEPFEEVIYPKGDIDAVSISKRDVDLLLPETFVNDTIIDFYIKYLKNQIQPEERLRFHFFNSFFFRKLADLDKDPSSISDGRAAFLRVRKWTRKLDMFGKDYIFIPVNFSLHWSLIVICHPGEVAGFEDEDLDKSSKVPCILHMDSIKGNHAGLKNLVQSYLWEEWKERHKETSEDLSSKFLNLRFVSLELPQQENSFDCGLFLLHYLELFLAEAPSNFNPFKITKFSNFLNLDWFPPTEASLKRTLIQKLIFELLEIRSREMSSSDCSDEPHSSRFPEEIGNGGVEFVPKSVSPEVACHGNLNSQESQGIEMTLLASSSMRNVETVNDSGLVLREFFEPGVTAGSLLGQFQSFDQQPSYYNMNGAVSPREEWNAPKPRHLSLLEVALHWKTPIKQQFDLWSPLPNQGWKPCIDSADTPSLPERSQGYIQVFLDGGLNQQRMGICDAVAVAKILNATLVIPHLEVNLVWQDSSSFTDIFDVDHFINVLQDEVSIVKELPREYSWSSREYYATGIRATRIKTAPIHASADWYLENVLPVMRSYGIAAISPFSHRLAFDKLPVEIQHLRCKVNFEALAFVPRIRLIGETLVNRLRDPSGKLQASGTEVLRERTDDTEKERAGKFVVLHLRFDKDMAAHSACDFGGGKAEKLALAKYRQVLWQGRVLNSQFTDHELRNQGRCPLTPEEIGLLLTALGFNNNTHLYLASHKVYGGEARISTLRTMFPLMEDKKSLASANELAEVEGKASLMAAVDYYVSLKSDIFISASPGNMHNALLGHRAYLNLKTIRPNMLLLGPLFLNKTIEWSEFQHAVINGHKNRQGQTRLRKEKQSIYTYPAPDCMCRA